jgi:TPR repeat protein
MWYRVAASHGDATAIYNLGVCLETGVAGEPDPQQAVTLYSQAAAGGSELAMHRLGMCYQRGKGVVAPSPENAKRWFGAAAQKGYAPSMRMLGLALEKEGKLGEAFQSYKAAAELGDAVGMAFLADLYENGKGVGENIAEAVRWYKAAAAKNSGLALARLAACYRDGKGVPRNITEARALAKRAADMKVREGIEVLQSLG